MTEDEALMDLKSAMLKSMGFYRNSLLVFLSSLAINDIEQSLSTYHAHPYPIQSGI
jgi:hypothetical protein